MRTDYKLDNRKVICPNASLLAGRGVTMKAGACFTYINSERSYIARSLGRLVTTGGDDKGTTYILAMVLSMDGAFAFIRWVKPDDVTEIYESPAKLAAFFFAPSLPYDAATMVRLIDYGTVSERYIENAATHVAEWQAGTRAKP